MCVKHLLNVHLARLFAVPLLGALVVFALTPAVGADEAASSAQIKQWLEKADHASQALRHVAAQVRPSVVAVNTTFASPAGRVLPNRRDPLAEALRDFFGQEYFERFFQDRRPGEGIPFPLRGQQRHGQASGLIISADGHIVTNERAVRGAEAVSVQLHDGRKLPAEIVGVDRKFDLAVLSIKAKNLQPAKLGDSNGAQLFDWVIAIGSPYGIDQAVSYGIVSAKGVRPQEQMVPYEEFLQTTAPIHPALAGGPLVNLKGVHDPLRVHGGKLKGGSAQAYFAARVAAARCDWRFFLTAEGARAPSVDREHKRAFKPWGMKCLRRVFLGLSRSSNRQRGTANRSLCIVRGC